MCARTFARRLSRIWRSRSRSPCTSTGDRRVELDLAARVERARRLDRVARDVAELDGLALERPALVEAGEQEEIVDEQPHPPGLALDPGHRALEVVRPLARAAVEQLRVGAHGGKRRAQLVRRIGDEAAQPVLRRGALVERLLDLAEHRVERPAEPADLGARVVVLDALGEVAAGDRGGRRARSARAAAGRPGRARGRAGGPRRAPRRRRQLDEQQLVQRVVDVVERRGDDEELVVPRERLELHPEPRAPVDGVTVNGSPSAQPPVARSPAGRLRQRRLAGPRPDRRPAHGSRSSRRRRRRGRDWPLPMASRPPGPGRARARASCAIASALAVAVRSTRSTRNERSGW